MKDNKLKIIILVIILAILDIITFLLLNDYTASIIINIISINIAIIISFILSNFSSKNKEYKYLDAYKLPIISMFTTVDIVASILLIILSKNNLTITLISQLLIYGIFAIIFLANKNVDNTIINNDTNDKVKIDKCREIQNSLKNILNEIEDRKLYKKIENLYDNARSLNVSNNKDNTNIDLDILSSINELEKAIYSSNTDLQDKLINTIDKKLKERNRL